MKRRSFLRGLLAAGALGLTLSAGGAFRLERQPLAELDPIRSSHWSNVPGDPLNTDEWRKTLAETMMQVDDQIRANVYEPPEWILAPKHMHAQIHRVLDSEFPWHRRIERRFRRWIREATA